MAANTRSGFQREADYERITSLYLRGWRQTDIAAELGLTQQQVSYDLRVVQKRWRESTTMNLDEAKQKELSRIDELQNDFWTAWEESKKDVVTVGVEKKSVTLKIKDASGGDIGLPAIERKDSRRRTGQSGNPAFLQGVLSCIDRRCKLLGLDAPERKELTGKDGGPMQVEQRTKPDLTKLSTDELLQLRQIVTKASDGVTNS